MQNKKERFDWSVKIHHAVKAINMQLYRTSLKLTWKYKSKSC